MDHEDNLLLVLEELPQPPFEEALDSGSSSTSESSAFDHDDDEAYFSQTSSSAATDDEDAEDSDEVEDNDELDLTGWPANPGIVHHKVDYWLCPNDACQAPVPHLGLCGICSRKAGESEEQGVPHEGPASPHDSDAEEDEEEDLVGGKEEDGPRDGGSGMGLGLGFWGAGKALSSHQAKAKGAKVRPGLTRRMKAEKNALVAAIVKGMMRAGAGFLVGGEAWNSAGSA